MQLYFFFLFLLFQGAFRIFNDPVSRENTMLSMHLRPSKPIDCVVRVYVIRVSKDCGFSAYLFISGRYDQDHSLLHIIHGYRRCVNYSSLIPFRRQGNGDRQQYEALKLA